MKYIRTKDGVYEVSSKQKNTYYVLNGRWQFEKQDIINQSENLEELCDEFVKIWNNTDLLPELLEYDEEYECEQENMKYVYPKGNIIIYGCIWTDKGLIYVAKMNESGELELI